MQEIIANHNKRELKSSTSEERRGFPATAMIKQIVLLMAFAAKNPSFIRHQSYVKAMAYYGCCETDFKARYYNHIQSFKNLSKKNQTELS